MDYIEFYRNRLDMHKDYVRHFYLVGKANGLITYPEIESNIDCHDDDKYEPANLEIQARRYIPDYDWKHDPEVFKCVLHHVNFQPHHPQYWNPTEVSDPFNEKVDCTEMPYTYLYEMACDWMAVAKEKKQKPFDWYNKKAGTMIIFDEMQSKYLHNMFTIMGKELL